MKQSIIFTFLFLLPVILTAQKKDLSKPWFFIQVTDPQFGMFENNKGFEKETVLYEKAVSEINQLHPDFVMITGDLVHNGKDAAEIAEFKGITAKIDPDIPVYYTPGNHDLGQEPTGQSIHTFIKNYGYDRFSFKHKGSLFIGFNSSLIKNDLPELEQKQFEWLKRKLKGSKKASHVLLFCHYPFFIQSIDEPEGYSNISLEKRQKYIRLFKKNHVEAVFSGHLHKNKVNNYDGIQWIITSAVGKPLGNDPSGIRIVKVFNDKVESKYYGLDEVPDIVTY
ncbi:MAG TPA: metallophosphoesterase [Draconibacterium sp.]|nr:metallophosphoesterase [Draconibacterium sp.]